MIDSFGDQRTEDIFHGVESKLTRGIPKDVARIARRKLDMINAAKVLQDLRVPPGNRLEALKGDLKGAYSIRVNDQFRVVFKFVAGIATDVVVADYH